MVKLLKTIGNIKARLPRLESNKRSKLRLLLNIKEPRKFEHPHYLLFLYTIHIKKKETRHIIVKNESYKLVTKI